MFSNSIKLENLNDYNNEAEKCIKPFLYNNSSNDNKENENIIQVERPNLINIKKIKKKNYYNKKERGEISLTDCLACSGCVTNEETTFLKSQNYIEIINTVKKKKINIMSLSLQSVTALSVYYKLPVLTIQKKLCFFFKSLNFDYVYDSSLGELITLNEAKKEFLEYFFKNNDVYENNIYRSDGHVENMNHKKKKNIFISKIFNDKNKTKNKIPSHNDNIDNMVSMNNMNNAYDEDDKYVSLCSNNSSNIFSLQYIEKQIGKKTLPLICSHCSGTVLYGEKNFDDDILNSLSKTKSSQDIQGIILKILHLHNSVINTYPCLNDYYIYNNFFKLYNYKFNWISICNKYFNRNYRFNENLLKTKKKYINNDDDDNNMTVLNDMEVLNIYDINHVYLLYCFDKKLEACRIYEEQQTSIENNMKNYLSGQNIDYNIFVRNEQNKNKFYGVDAVMTTVELIEMIKNMNIDFYTLPELNIDNIYKLIKRTCQNYVSGSNNITSGLSDILNERDTNSNNKKNKKINNNNNINKNNNINSCSSSSNNVCSVDEYLYVNTINDKEEKKKNKVILSYFEETKYMKYIYDDLFLRYLIRSSHKNNISMGYGEEIFKYVCKEIFNFEVDKELGLNLKYEDIIVLSLFKNNTCMFRVILSYGFKSMHNVLRKIKELKNENIKNYKNMDEQISHVDDNKNEYDINITYNLRFNGRIDYVELMACEKGCLFGCAQNIFSQHVEKFSNCSCNNIDIFKKIAKQEVISNFDFLQVSNDNKKKEKKKFCCNENHKNYIMNSLYKENNNNNEYINNNDQEHNNIFKYKDKEKLFMKLYDTMHDDKYTLYVNSNDCIYDETINSFLKNIFHAFNHGTFHLFKATFSSKKKLDITNW
ncbi:cytosolic Fe-S cluster assembly factor NAR1, putative [Plasmodium sp. DRC-Itaito]|nr:cytosolic Fe-S cluster assembly factor NAR1, putative [Plasmodium sp. DRC-Itaito]